MMQRDVLEYVSDCASFGYRMQIYLINMYIFKEKEDIVENQLLKQWIN